MLLAWLILSLFLKRVCARAVVAQRFAAHSHGQSVTTYSCCWIIADYASRRVRSRPYWFSQQFVHVIMDRDAPAIKGFRAREVWRSLVVDLAEVLRAGAAEARYPGYPQGEPALSRSRVPVVVRVAMQLAPQSPQER